LGHFETLFTLLAAAARGVWEGFDSNLHMQITQDPLMRIFADSGQVFWVCPKQSSQKGLMMERSIMPRLGSATALLVAFFWQHCVF
jgi:hypothetical protein